ncbi:MAG: hypothetical protein ACO1QB_11340 [Verrucomicrobiales bacterium]
MKTDHDELMEKALKGRLSSSEKAAWENLLRTDPTLASKAAEEASLNHLLEKLPDVPLSSNFTALTVQAALRENRSPRAKATTARTPWWRSWARVGLSGAMACLAGVFLFYQQQVGSQKELAESIRSVSEMANLPAETGDGEQVAAVEVWQNFDAIYRLGHMPRQEEVDNVLLIALEK